MKGHGRFTTFLGTEINSDHPMRILHLSQHRYINTILLPHGIPESAPVSTSADPHVQLLKSPPPTIRLIDLINKGINQELAL